MAAYVDITPVALVTTAALGCGLLLTKLRQPAIIGYILAGIVLGPTGLALIQNSDSVALLAELGILMLLFIVGMELSLRSFITVLGIALPTAAGQILLSLGLAFGLGHVFGWSTQLCLVFGFLFALSSTAVAIKMLEDIGELRTHLGRVVVGVLIAQDLAVVAMLLVVDGMKPGESLDVIGLSLKIGLAMAFLGGLIWYLSRRERVSLPFWSRIEQNRELVPLAALGGCFSVATLCGLAGLSAAYGAFLAGLVIGNSSARKATLETTEPIQNILLVAFFLSIGLMIDLQFILDNIAMVLGLLALVTLVKTVMNVGLLKLFGEPWSRAFPGGLVLGQLSEFGFLLATAAVAVQVLDRESSQMAITVIALSFVISPVWLVTARRFISLLRSGVTSSREAMIHLADSELSLLHHLLVAVRLRRAEPAPAPEAKKPDVKHVGTITSDPSPPVEETAAPTAATQADGRNAA